MNPAIKVTFESPQNGWWNGGAKSGGEFEPDMNEFEPKSSIKWRCWRLNFWFKCKSGRSWREAAAIAKRKLEHMIKVPCTIEIIN